MESDPPFVKEIDARAAQGDEACMAAAARLQAMRSVICTQGCQGSATAYFAAAVTTLQRHLEQGGVAAGEDRTAPALLLILRRSMSAVPATVVQARLNDVIATLNAALKRSDSEEISRLTLGCLAAAAELAYEAGSRPNRKVLKPVFSFASDARAPVRHRAQLAAATIIRRGCAQKDEQTLEFCTQHLVQMISSTRSGDKRALEELSAHQAILVLQQVASSLPIEALGAACTALVQLPAQLGQHPCCTSAFEFLATQLGWKDEEEEIQAEEKTKAAELASKLLPGLLGLPSNVLNVAYVVAMTKALAAATSALSARGPPLAAPAQRLAAFRKALALFSERDPSVLKGAREACLRVCTAAGEGADLALLDEASEACRPLLGFERKGAWQHALPVIEGVFDAVGAMRLKVPPAEVLAWTRARFERARALIGELVECRDKARGAELNVFGRELDDCLGAAVRAFGPESVLEVAPLQLLEHSLADNNYMQLSRSWLLLILKDSCQRSSLSFFARALLPLVTGLQSRCVEAESKSPILAKKYSTLVEQVWALLPAFCNEPLDLGSAMLAEGGKLAKQLVAVLLNEARLRDFVWTAFARACAVTDKPPTPLSEALQESNRTCLRTLSSRVMPEMFTAYLRLRAEAEGQEASRESHSRRLALDSVQSYARIAEPELTTNLFKNIVQRLLKTTAGPSEAGEVSPAQAVPLADLANALVPCLAGDVLELVLKVFTPMLKGAAPGVEDKEAKAVANALQKAAYKAVSSVFQHSAALEVKQGEDSANLLGFWAVLRDARQVCEPAAMKARLVAIGALLTLMEQRLAPRFKEPGVRQEYVQCLTTVLPEVLLHLKDQSAAVREAARECLHVAATTAIHQELQTEIVTLLSAGLAGLTAHSKASAVDALSRLVYEHSGRMAASLKDRLIQVVLLLLQDGDVQVFRSAVKFAKVTAFVTPKETLPNYLPQILKVFENRHVASTKMAVRRIVERLVKVIDPEELARQFPKAHASLLVYVQRQIARRERPKTVRAAGGEEEEDDSSGKKDADMEDEGSAEAPRKSWKEFQDDEDGGEDDAEVAAKPAGRRKRTRGDAPAAKEPPASAVAAHESVQALLDAWEAESDGSDGEGNVRRKRNSLRDGKKRARDSVEASTWIQEDKDVPLDFMSADAAHSVLTTRPPDRKRRRGNEVSAGGATAENKADALRRTGLRFAEDGRLVIAEEKENIGEEEGKEKKFNLGTSSEQKPKALSKLAALRAARVAAKAKARAERRRGHVIKGMENFKPGKKNAQGDAKRKGQTLEPFAYVKLNPKVTKEKFKGKATESFARVVKGVKKGVVKGMKARRLDAQLQKAKEAKSQRRHKQQKNRKTNAR